MRPGEICFLTIMSHFGAIFSEVTHMWIYHQMIHMQSQCHIYYPTFRGPEIFWLKMKREV